MAPLWTALILFFVFCFEPVKAELCYDYNADSYFTSYPWKECSYGCCTSIYDVCCSFILTGWMIGLIVSGSIVFISVIVAVICCCVKSHGQAGRVVQPVPHSGVTVISAANNSSTMQQQQGYYGPPQGPYGPSHGFSYSSGPPGYPQAYGPPPGPPAYSDPAFLPGQTNIPASPFASAAGKSAN